MQVQKNTSVKKQSEQTEHIQGTKFVWQIKKTDDALVRSISTKHAISYPVAQILCTRGLTDENAIRSYLFTTQEQNVAHASLLKDAGKATDRILKAIKNKEKILIVGDYDVDGITSTSIILLSLIPLEANVNYFLPHRVKDGYGLSKKIVKKAAQSGYSLIITVDNGITAYKAAQEAQKLKIDLIITDHHRQLDKLPEALAIVNPNQDACSYPHKTLAGVGVAFKLISLLYEKLNKKLPDKIYELLLLGTVADVVPLEYENRFWVRYGLHKINKSRSLALSVLSQNSKLTKNKLNSLDIGFMIAPQINALGRLDDSREAVKFLISSDSTDVSRIGHILHTMNEERKRVDAKIYEQIEGAIINKHIDLENENIILAAHENWPSGVIGLVAGKLMHNHGRPAFLFHIDKKKGHSKRFMPFDSRV